MGADEAISAAGIDGSAQREVIAAAEIEVRKCAGGSLLAAGGGVSRRHWKALAEHDQLLRLDSAP